MIFDKMLRLFVHVIAENCFYCLRSDSKNKSWKTLVKKGKPPFVAIGTDMRVIAFYDNLNCAHIFSGKIFATWSLLPYFKLSLYSECCESIFLALGWFEQSWLLAFVHLMRSFLLYFRFKLCNECCEFISFALG